MAAWWLRANGPQGRQQNRDNRSRVPTFLVRHLRPARRPDYSASAQCEPFKQRPCRLPTCPFPSAEFAPRTKPEAAWVLGPCNLPAKPASTCCGIVLCHFCHQRNAKPNAWDTLARKLLNGWRARHEPTADSSEGANKARGNPQQCASGSPSGQTESPIFYGKPRRVILLRLDGFNLIFT